MNQKYLALASQIAREGGQLLKENFRCLTQEQIHEKGPGDLVTDLDRALEKKYTEAILSDFPDHGILGEEGANVNPKSDYRWIIDPLDGTKNYAEGRPMFCTMMCLFHKEDPLVSVIYEPLNDDLFTASAGEGSWCNGERINVSALDRSTESTLVYCQGRRSQEKILATRYVPMLEKKYRKILHFTAGSEMATVARGKAEVCLMSDLPVWDMAPGILIVREAGGKITTFTGDPWTMDSTNVVMSNGTGLHDEILKIINHPQPPQGG